MTLGDHIYKKAEIIPTLEKDERVCKPANFPPDAPGREFALAHGEGRHAGRRVLSLLGRTFMRPVDCPFRAADRVLQELAGQTCACIVVDMHAEATADKYLMGHHLKGRVSAVLGTHTHVPTADEQILPGGTAFICDVGMTGPYDSILGRRIDRVLPHDVTFVPSAFDVATGDPRLAGGGGRGGRGDRQGGGDPAGDAGREGPGGADGSERSGRAAGVSRLVCHLSLDRMLHQPAHAGRSPGASVMRLMTYNIHKGVGADRRYRLDRAAAVIAAEAPDLVCLQEVDRNVRRSRHDDQPALLAERLRAEFFLYQLNVPHGEGGYGNLLLSRWPIRDSRGVSLHYRRRTRRGAQLAVVETPEGPLHLVHVHFGLSERERRWQAATLLEQPEFEASAHLPTLIAGDFNDWRNTLGRRCLLAHGFRPATTPIRRFRTFPAFLPLAAIDKIYVRGGLRVVETRVVYGRPARRASDHLPVVCDFHLDGPT